MNVVMFGDIYACSRSMSLGIIIVKYLSPNTGGIYAVHTQ